jgi:hypothetical protein
VDYLEGYSDKLLKHSTNRPEPQRLQAQPWCIGYAEGIELNAVCIRFELTGRARRSFLISFNPSGLNLRCWRSTAELCDPFTNILAP